MSHRLLVIMIGFLMLVSPCSNSAAQPQAPAILIVNSLLDDLRDCSKTCTLRSAIATANPGDVIEFDPGLTGTITLVRTLVIDKNLTINGPGADVLALDGGQEIRVFEISAGTTVSIAGLTIQNGSSDSGGGILNNGNLTVTASTFSGNSVAGGGGGGIANYNAGVLTVTASTFSGNSAYDETGLGGGGIFNAGALTVTASIFSGNSASLGGGITNNNTLTVTASTFSNNSATRDYGGYGGGGGIINGNWGRLTVTTSTFSANSAGQGGGITNTGTLTVTASTFSDNKASGDYGGGGIINTRDLAVTASTFSGNSAANGAGGGIASTGNLVVTASTFSGNSANYGGGIDNWGYGALTVTASTFSANSASFTGGGIGIAAECSLDLSSTIVAGNTADEEGPDIYGEVNSLSYNLIGNPHGVSGLWVSDLQNVDPLLGPLADNGGPTQTMALLEGSPAIDAGDPRNCPETDQRGAARVGLCDIGAYEFDGVVPEE